MPAPIVIESLDDAQFLFDQIYDQGLGALAQGKQMAVLQEFAVLNGARSVLASAVGGGLMSPNTDIAAISLQIVPGRPLFLALQGDAFFHNSTFATQTPACRPYVDGGAVSYTQQALEFSDSNGRSSPNGTNRSIRNMAWLITAAELPSRSKSSVISVRDPSNSTDGTGSSYWQGGNLVLSGFQF